MPGNTLGHCFAVTTFGESHGPALGCVIDGCPANFSISEQDIQPDLDRRRPGHSQVTSQRREADQVKIISGTFEGKTTGAPICLLIDNTDQRSQDYTENRHKFRPGHGDFSYQAKYGIRDYRGGGRASARETVARVAAGAIAKKYLREQFGLLIYAYVKQIGHIVAENYADLTVTPNEFNFIDPTKLVDLRSLIKQLRAEGDSIGALIEVVATNMPLGLGEPVFDRLDADLAHALMSINAVKGVELGAGFACVNAKGSNFRDEIFTSGFGSNNAGGVLAGISTGQDLVARIAFKPAASIRISGRTTDLEHHPTEIVTTGRHDPCVGIRAVPIVEAMVGLVLIDHLLRQRAQNGHVFKDSGDRVCSVSDLDVGKVSTF